MGCSAVGLSHADADIADARDVEGLFVHVRVEVDRLRVTLGVHQRSVSRMAGREHARRSVAQRREHLFGVGALASPVQRRR